MNTNFFFFRKRAPSTTIINNSNNYHNNNRNNTSNKKESSNTLITITLPKRDSNFNDVAVKEGKVPVPKKVLLRQNINIEKHPQKHETRLTKINK